MIRKKLNHDHEGNASEYVTGELSRRVAHWFEAHLIECDECWREVWFGRLGRRLAERGRELAPAGLREDVRAAVLLTAESTPKRRGRRGTED